MPDCPDPLLGSQLVIVVQLLYWYVKWPEAKLPELQSRWGACWGFCQDGVYVIYDKYQCCVGILRLGLRKHRLRDCSVYRLCHEYRGFQVGRTRDQEDKYFSVLVCLLRKIMLRPRVHAKDVCEDGS